MKSRRIFMSLAGVSICAVSVGIFKIAAFGVDPFQALMSGLDNMIPIPFGTLYVLVNLVLLVFSLIADRSNIGIATFLNLFLLGYITQFTYEMLQILLPAPTLIVRALCLLAGIVIICFGSSLYMTAKLGVSIDGATLYCTHQPCSMCCKMIINSGIKRVIYKEGYPDPFTLELFAEAGVQLERYEDEISH